MKTEFAAENYSIKWIEDANSVADRKKAGQYTAVSRQVNGSNNYVTWFTFEPSQKTVTSWTEQFFAYQSNTKIESGVTIQGMNSSPVNLGSWYQFSDDTNSWSSMSAPPSGQSDVPSDSVGLFYAVPSSKPKQTTLGLQCKVSTSAEAAAICADTIFSNQPVIYKPLTTLYASMGRTYQSNTVIASIGNWDTLEFSGTSTEVKFNDGQSSWQVVSSREIAIS